MKHTALILAALLSFLVSAPSFAATPPCIKHAHVSGLADNAAVDISSGEWNECHDIDDAAVDGIKTAHRPNLQTGTTYTVQDSDRGKLVTHTNAAAIAVTLPQAGAGSAFIDGWFYDVQNRGAGTVTITPTTSTIDGAASLALTTGQGTRLFSNGSNYFTQRGMTGGVGGADNLGTATFSDVVTLWDGGACVGFLKSDGNCETSTTFTDSAGLRGQLSDETGSGAAVFATAPTISSANLTAPVLGVATATSINKYSLTAPASGATITIADGKTFTLSNTLTFTGTDSSSVAFGTGGTVAYTSGFTLSGQLVASNLGIEFGESDTNPGCAAGNFTLYADTSENKLKKCENGVLTDVDATGGGDVSAAANFDVDNVVIRSNGTSKGVQKSGVELDDSNNISTPGSGSFGVGSGTAGVTTWSGGTSGSAAWGAADIAGSAARVNVPIATGAAGAILRTDGSTPQQTSWVSFTDVKWYEAAGCNNATAGPIWNLPTSNAPAAACVGSNTRLGVLNYDADTDESAFFSIMLPAGFTGAIDIKFRWYATATSGAVGWCALLVRVPDGATSDPSLPVQAGNCVSDTAKGTTLQENDATVTGVTCTSCVAGDRVNVGIVRDANGSAVTDSMTGDASLVGVEITTRRQL